MTASTASHRVPTASDAKDAVLGTGSRNVAENGNRVPATASPRPTASRPRPDRVPAFRDAVRVTASRAIYKRDAGRGASDPPLPTWLQDLKHRNLTIDITTDGPKITGPRTDLIGPTDWHQLNRHRHALQTAATGTHPDWWNHVLGHTDHWPHPDQLPWTCATCGTPDCPVLDANLIAWCDQHAPELEP